jgi:hypothetical protein
LDGFNQKVSALRLDSSPGLDIQRQIWRLFHCPVAFSLDHCTQEFWLVASFGRASFRLDLDSVSAALSACLGGIAKDFHVTFLRDRTFRFSVCSRNVGFFCESAEFVQLQRF